MGDLQGGHSRVTPKGGDTGEQLKEAVKTARLKSQRHRSRLCLEVDTSTAYGLFFGRSVECLPQLLDNISFGFVKAFVLTRSFFH